MVAKITVGTSLYGALAYNGMKVNEGEGKLLAVNKVFDDGLSAINFAYPITAFVQAVGFGIGMGGSVCISLARGRGDDRRAEPHAGTCSPGFLPR